MAEPAANDTVYEKDPKEEALALIDLIKEKVDELHEEAHKIAKG